MAEVTKPLALDETLQDVAAKLGRISSVAGASAYTQAVAGGYTGTQAEFEAQIAKQPIVVNPNLLINSYFVGGGSQRGGGQLPINQKGQTTWSLTAPSWNTIDFWRNVGGYQGNAATFTLLTEGLKIVASSTTGAGGIQQRLENKLALSGKTITFSVLGQVLTGTWRISSQSFQGQDVTSSNTDVLFSHTATLSDLSSYSVWQIGVEPRTSSAQILLKAMKLELGFEQTLAHNEGTDANPVWVLNEIPNYTEELWKCQRYYQLFASSSYRPTYGEDYRPPMRVHSPSKGTITIGGTTYYYADANL